MTIEDHQSFAVAQKLITKAEGQMEFSNKETHEGIRAALAIEAIGGWKEFDPSSHPAAVQDADVAQMMEELKAYAGPADMPPDPRHLRILVDAAAFLHGEANRAAGWDINGILPGVGRRLLNGTREIFWTVYFTAFCFGIGHARLEDPRTYRPEEVE